MKGEFAKAYQVLQRSLKVAFCGLELVFGCFVIGIWGKRKERGGNRASRCIY